MKYRGIFMKNSFLVYCRSLQILHEQMWKSFLAFVLLCGSMPLFAENPEDLPDFTPSFMIRSAYDGSVLTIDEKQLNWNLREITDDSGIKERDPWPFFKLSYVQFVSPNNADVCLAIDESGKFVGKSCKKDIESKKLETLFSIIPTTTSAVQIRSMVLNADECITFFNTPRKSGFGINSCDVDRLFNVDLRNLMLILPPFQAAVPINP